MNLKTYEITLIAKSPVFVGNGKSYTKKEYLIANNKVHILNMNKLYAFLFAKKLDRSFEQFMLGNERDLFRWLKEKNLFNDALKCADYSLNLDTRDLKGLEIKSAIKDAYGNPYIPGSSLKGALRTILAAYRISENDALRANVRRELETELPNKDKKSRKQYLSNVVKNAEGRIFRTLNLPESKSGDAVNDILKGFIVGDSEPLSVNDLTLAQKIERHKDGKEKSLNLMRESIKPGTKIVFPLTIDEDICKFSEADILEAIYKFDDMYNENFLKKFEDIDALRADKPQIFLGGGAGFVSKTLVYPIMGQKNGVDATVKIFENTGVPFKHKHSKDKGLGVSPHIVKCTRYNGKTLQMGLCEFSIILK